MIDDKIIALIPLYEAGIVSAERIYEVFGITKEDLEK